jgi:hypothetical protein
VVPVTEKPHRPAGLAGARHREPRLLVGLGVTVVSCIVLVVVARLGASWPVVVVATTGTALSLWFGRLSRRLGLGLLLAVGGAGLLWIEAVNIVQYGSLALTGPPAKVWWCGDSYTPSGAVTRGLSDGDGPPFNQILTTPAAYSVYGVDNGDPGTTCGATEPLLVQVGPGRYEVYNP